MGLKLPLGAALVLPAMLASLPAHALVDIGGGVMCKATSAYVNGQYQGTYYYDCTSSNPSVGGTMPPPMSGGGVGNINVPFSSLQQLPISSQLNCALGKYTSQNAKPKAPIKNANGYAYATHLTNGQQIIKYTQNWVALSTFGSGTVIVGGLTTSSPSVSYIFNAAYKLPVSGGLLMWRCLQSRWGRHLLDDSILIV